METISIISILVLGFGLGVKHAVEADHLAAVSTIVSERRSVWSAAWVGGLWGLGHTISLFAAGLAVILFHFEISERAGKWLEFGVAVMLIVLGLNALRKLAFPGKVHPHAHTHGDLVDVHPHLHDTANALTEQRHEGPEHEHRVGLRPLVVGMVHGLAGSGALMLIVLATIPSPPVALTYIIVFGAGSIGGMMLMSVLIGLPFHLTADRHVAFDLMMRYAAGLFSLGIGVFMVFEFGAG